MSERDAAVVFAHGAWMVRRRSRNTALIFLAAMSCAIIAQWLGFALVGCGLFSYLAPELSFLHFANKPQT